MNSQELVEKFKESTNPVEDFLKEQLQAICMEVNADAYDAESTEAQLVEGINAGLTAPEEPEMPTIEEVIEDAKYGNLTVTKRGGEVKKVRKGSKDQLRVILADFDMKTDSKMNSAWMKELYNAKREDRPFVAPPKGEPVGKKKAAKPKAKAKRKADKRKTLKHEKVVDVVKKAISLLNQMSEQEKEAGRAHTRYRYASIQFKKQLKTRLKPTKTSTR